MALAADFATAMRVAAKPRPLNVVFVNAPTVPFPRIDVAEFRYRYVNFLIIDIIYSKYIAIYP